MIRTWHGGFALAACVLASCAATRVSLDRRPGRQYSAFEISEKVSLHLEGVEALDRDQVITTVEDQLESVLTAKDTDDPEPLADAIVTRLIERYRSLGYPHVELTCDVSGMRVERNSRRVNIRAIEGPRVMVGSLRVEGSTHIRPDELARFYFDFAPRSRPLIGTHLFVQRMVDQAVQRIEERYQVEGFLKVVVRADPPAFSEDRATAYVRIRVGEGPRATLREIQIRGASVDPAAGWREVPLRMPEARSQIGAALDGVGVRVGAPFGRVSSIKAINAITELYHEQGYPKVLVQPLETTATTTGELPVTLVLRIREGVPAGIRTIRASGNSWTADTVLTRESSHLIGDTYQGSALRDVQQTLTRLAIFKSVDVDWAPTPGRDDWVDVNIAVEESDWLILRSDFGYASSEGLRFAPTLDLPNVIGLGHNMQARGIVSEVRQRLEGKMTAPWSAGLPIRSLAEISWEDRPEPLSRSPSFRIESVRGAFTLARPLIGPLEGVASYEIERSRVYDLADGIVLQTQLGTSADATVPDLQLSAVSVGWVLDGRDDRFNPRVGAYADMLFTAAGGDLRGNVRFERLKGTLAAYTSAWRTTLGVRGSAQSVRYHATTQFPTLPPPYRQFSGGHDTVRSFGEGELGPRTVDDPSTLGNEGGSSLGGLARGTVNVELRTRVWPAPERPFGVSVLLFGDAGVVWPYRAEARAMVPIGEDRDRYRTRPTDIAFALGVGLRLDTPIGPIGVDLGWNPDRFRIPPSRDTGGPRHEDAFAVFVQVGQTF